MSTSKKELFSGVRDTIPLLIGAFPFGMIYGALALNAGLSKIAVITMSLIVFAGSSQFIAVGLYSVNTPVLIIVLTTLIVNLRHLLYSLSLLPQMKDLPTKWKIPLAFWLTDETYTVSVIRYQQDAVSGNAHWYQLGSSIAMYVNWQLWTIVGVELGETIPSAANWGLDVAMPIAFIGMLIPFVRGFPVLVCVVSAGITSLTTAQFPLKLGLLVSVLVGITAGLIAESRLKKLERTENEI